VAHRQTDKPETDRKTARESIIMCTDKKVDGQTDGQTGCRQTDRQTDRRTDRQTDRQTRNRQKGSQTGQMCTDRYRGIEAHKNKHTIAHRQIDREADTDQFTHTDTDRWKWK